MKDTLEEMNSRVNQKDLEDIVMEIIQLGQQKEKQIENGKQFKGPPYQCVMGAPETEEEREGGKKCI